MTQRKLTLLYSLFIAAFILTASCAPVATSPVETAEYEEPAPPVVRNREASLPLDAVKNGLSDDKYPLHLHSSEWYYPITVLGSVNTAGFEELPYIVPDGSLLYFFFTPGVTATEQAETGTWVSYSGSDGFFSAAEFVTADNYRIFKNAVAMNDTAPWLLPLSPAGNTAVYADDMRGALDDDLLQGVHPDENAAGWCMSPDGKALYFHTEKNPGKGGSDIWVIENKDGQWQDARNFTEVNTDSNESYPFITCDGTELWFTRDIDSRPAIYRSVKSGVYWLKPQLIIANNAVAPSLDCKGNIYFAHSYTGENKIMESDIFVSYKKKKCG